MLTSKEPDATPTAARARAGPRRGRGDRGGWPVGLAWALWALALLSLAAVAWLDHLLRRAGRPELAVLTLEGATNAALPHVGVATVGAVVASRRPRHPVGWLLLAVALAPNPLTAPYQVPTTPFDLHGVRGAALVADQAGFAAAAVAVVVGAASLLVRFRRARGVERQQLRWVALAAVAAVLLVGAVGADEATGGAVVRDPGLAGVLSLAVLEVGIGASVLRYRLYDLDRIISRTVAWGVLTVLLGGGYAGVILGLGALLGHDSSLAVAAATLALAAAFQPARRLVQSAVDRRFNRSRYDAARTIQAFAARLRQQVDLDSLTDELLAVVDQTMQPTRSSLWLRPAPLPGTTGAAGAAAPARTSGTRH